MAGGIMRKLFKTLMLSALVCGCAVIGALAGCAKMYEGKYEYTQYGTNYGVKVQVRVDENKVIKSVRIVGSDYVDVSPAGGDRWTQEKVDNWKNNIKPLLQAYEGRTVSEILAMQVAVSEAGAPLSANAEGVNAYDSALIISGATMGSGRVLLAVQDAVKNLK